MKISLNWLKEYVDLNGISVKEIVQQLTMSGLEVEDHVDQNEIYKNFVVGSIIKKEKHSNADKLSVCIVNDGNEELQVICGAPNVEAGQKVVFAKIGAIVPKGNFEIKKAKIRGVESSGMICAADELDLGDDHSGIMVLDNELKEGTPISEALGLDDVLMDIAITPNRPDALSHIGVARDLSAIFDRDLKLPKINIKEIDKHIFDYASIEIEDKVNCPRYSSRVVIDVTIKESPEWLKKKLTSIGLRPINNVVDVTNFILHETGQPLHAFDLDKLADKKIVVKSTKGKIRFTTLDSKNRELPENTLMICDGKNEVAIAGVMGGENSEVTNQTKNILIESAYFNSSSVRKTAKSLSLSTDASYRFERGTDPSNTLYSTERAAQLIAEFGDGKIVKGAIDVYPKKIALKEIKLRLQKLESLLGYKIEKQRVQKILNRLGINVLKDLGEALEVSIPLFRPDIEREADLIEEVARIFSYDKIPTVNKISTTLEQKKDDSEFADKIREVSVSLGLYEMINNPLQSAQMTKLTGVAIEITNPQSVDMGYLRTSLLSGTLQTISNNINKNQKSLALFEIGNVFQKINKDINSFEDFTETTNFIISVSGYLVKKEWYNKEEKYDFFYLKGLIDSLLAKITLDNELRDSYNSGEKSIYEYQFSKNFNNEPVGSGGKINKSVLKQFGIDQDVYCFEFDLNRLKSIKTKKKGYVEPLRFPGISRDFSFIFDTNVKYSEVKEFITKNASSLLKDVNIFDVYENQELGENKKSLAINLDYYDKSRTLTEDEVEKDFLNLIKLITSKFNAVLRGN
jgi:phenylalanyl-tRNA synthetase beta chain